MKEAIKEAIMDFIRPDGDWFFSPWSGWKGGIITGVLVTLLLWGVTAMAGVTVTTDALGTTTYRGTGDDYGYKVIMKTDALGTDTYRDNEGNRLDCRYDGLGNYVCH